MNILLSGSTGVLGRRVQDLFSSTPDSGSVVPLAGDIRDARSVRTFFEFYNGAEFSHLIHAAAIVPIEKVAVDPRNAWAVNVVGTRNLLRAFAARFPRAHITLISSSHVYGPRNSPLDENALTKPSSEYGTTKLEAELEALKVRDELGTRLSILRLFSFYSADQSSSFLYPGLLARCSAQPASAYFELPGWNNIRDFSTAEFMAQCVASLSLFEPEGIVNVGSGIPETVANFAERVLGVTLNFRDHDAVRNPTSVVADVTILRAALAQAKTEVGHVLRPFDAG